ncbi:hypothetical protein PF005_g1185 [Phytophthora fragariae]|uniref:Uncharacterized protein n=1 Tax=Phytophthora fragariae TaxID=53985 RepID=A0A6A3TK89_9STRA|nr:hypothetical protein PF003_g4469 [Phytophthora fragariae]KAE8948853.1 hypothetical protein PF009_g1580 [Phytophthora fragariae]KAE9029665.1 hypothetical protein PF011_g948 [Phytophthora fragariae]KAE9137836.1 hypothetical protein PF010_g1154 [Phytophthora fragariae]KAE9138234.1 hypothetical protein PF007_g1490 [Phytophthora fragariae]
MQDGGLFMMSPMNAAGEERLRQARACIRKTFGPGGTGRRTKRALEMPAAPPTPAKTPRTKMRQRIAQASQLSAEQLFFQEFGSCDELINTEFDLARPAGHPVPKTRRFGSGDAAAVSTYSAQQTTGAPTSYFSLHASSTAPAAAFTSSLPAPSTATVSQLARPSRIRTPRKAAIKRGRAGESSAEKELVLRKPRLGSGTDYSSSIAATSTFGAQAVPARKSLAFVTTRGDHVTQPSGPNRFYSRTSPSKFQFSSNATRLFSQRQAPLR